MRSWPRTMPRLTPITRRVSGPRFPQTDLEIKLRLQRVRWTTAKVKDQTCAGEACTVRVDITYQVGAPVPGVSTWNGFDLIEEQWVKTGGDWWYVPPKG